VGKKGVFGKDAIAGSIVGFLTKCWSACLCRSQDFLTCIGFEKDFQNASLRNFQNYGTFSSDAKVIQKFSPHGFNSFEHEETKQISKILRFLGGFKWGLYFSRFFFEKSSSNLVNQYFSF